LSPKDATCEFLSTFDKVAMFVLRPTSFALPAASKGALRYAYSPPCPSPVGSHLPNTWGLYDMHGNVFEWCSDWYGEYPDGDVVDPRGLLVGVTRDLRGGAWDTYLTGCRSAARACLRPSKNGVQEGADFAVGLRACFSLVDLMLGL